MIILVADDHTLFREGMRYILQDLGGELEILEADSLTEVTSLLSEQGNIDMLLLDLNMPGMEQENGLSMLRAQWPDIKIVVVSASESSHDVRASLSYGAKGYIPKSSSREIMVSALRLILSGGIYMPPFVLEDASEDIQRPIIPVAMETMVANNAIGLDSLTPRQQDVLACLAEGRSNKEIARELGLAEGTVKIHIAGILKALKVNNRTQAIIAAGKLRTASRPPS